ncbi:hypothetical protein R3P38DRAFT_2860101 [Favolaschia claudopus]|uniref:SET domain-containing protein n=1 Tax=Favolaschia claudopus TaxID=2862362 RepID=A0AAW0DLY2_9AGAR
MRQRFKPGASSLRTASAPVRKNAAADIIDLDSSPEPEKPPKPKPVINSGEVIVLDSDSESETVKRKSAARKAEKKTDPPSAPSGDIIVISDSDDEPAQVSKSTVLDIKQKPTIDSPNLQALSPTFPKEEEHFGPDDGMDSGGEDLSHFTQLTAGDAAAESLRAAGNDAMAKYTPPLQQENVTSHAPLPTVHPTDAPFSPRESPDRLPMSTVPEVGLDDEQSTPLVGEPVVSPSASPRPASDLPDSVDATRRGDHHTPSAEMLAHPAEPNFRVDLPVHALKQTTPPPSPHIPLASANRPSPRSPPSTPLRPSTRVQVQSNSFPAPSTSRSFQSDSPYHSIRDTALDTPAAALQRKLGLPSKGTAAVPRLDLARLPAPLPKKQSQQNPPQQSADKTPATDGHTRQSSTGAGADLNVPTELPPPTAMKKPASVKLNSHQWSQKSLVDAIIATGERNAQSLSTLPQFSRRAISPSSTPSMPQTERTLSSNAAKPRIKQEKPPSRTSSSLINDIIDLTLSDDETEAPATQSAPQSVSAPAFVPPIRPTPIGPAQNMEEILQAKANRLKKILAGSRSVSSSTTAAELGISQTSSLNNELAADVTRAGEDVAESGQYEATSPNREGDLPSGPSLPVFSPLPEQGPLRTSNGGLSEINALHLSVSDPGEMDVDEMPQPLVSTTDLATEPASMEVAIESSSTSKTLIEEDSTVPETQDRPIPSCERRSYDDVEVYDLEYIGPPEYYNPSSSTDPEEAFVEELAVPAVDPDNLSEASSKDLSTDKASGDEASGVSTSPRPLRRSSRRSSNSSAGSGYGDSRSISPDEQNDDSLPLSPASSVDDFFGKRDDTSLSSVESAAQSPYPVLTWQSYKQDLRNFKPRVHYATELVSTLHDHVHSYDETFRMLPHMRQVFESAILENTAEDEPDAPAIKIINDVDDEPSPPWEFYYSNELWLGEGIDPPDMSKLVGCDCVGKCDPKSTTCSCLKRQRKELVDYGVDGFAYDNKGCLKFRGPPVFECNSLCACDDDECKNRVVQHGRKCQVAIKKTADKGWGVFNAGGKKIPKGTFIGLYTGEFLRDDICERRGLVYDKSGRTYLMSHDWYHTEELNPDVEYTVDAYHVGNNHSCDPNCHVNACYIDHPDIFQCHIALFALREIGPEEELCFAYSGISGPDGSDNADDEDGDEDDGKGSKSFAKNKCFCGAPACRGFMFN